jgi:putative hydrolase of the HAD superfamily
MGKIGIAIFDMDDTILNTEPVFIKAQTAMLRTLAQYDRNINPRNSFNALREIDQELVRLHRGKHSYNFKKLAKALWLHLHEGYNKKKAATMAFIEELGRNEHPSIKESAEKHDSVMVEAFPTIKKGAKKTLEKLKKNYVLILFPSGEKNFQMRIIKHHKLDQIFHAICVYRRKNTFTFMKAKRLGEMVFAKFNGPPKRIVSIGDRISQDIIPAKKIGLETIWIPGPYDPGKREEAKANPDYEVSSIIDLLKILQPKN